MSWTLNTTEYAWIPVADCTYSRTTHTDTVKNPNICWTSMLQVHSYMCEGVIYWCSLMYILNTEDVRCPQNCERISCLFKRGLKGVGSTVWHFTGCTVNHTRRRMTFRVNVLDAVSVIFTLVIILRLDGKLLFLRYTHFIY